MRYVRGFIACLVLIFSCTALVAAQPYQSSQYEVEEYFFGSGGEVDQSSSTLRAQSSAGNLATGNPNSTSFQIFAGNVTPSEEYLEFSVSGATADLGTLSTGTTSTATGAFSVRAILAGGYTVQTLSNPPTNEYGRALAAKAALAAPIIGTEEFGINLVANTSPIVFGADPSPQPDSGFDPGFTHGEAAAGYDTPDSFQYIKDDVIASAPDGRGQTNFTISYIANVSAITEAGYYTMRHDLVATGTF